ncbi:hypothetical protein [Thermus thermamylovorans]|uniref:Lipoprotein n=1 Tax=Thermus thermamylovorans TaxID=2509362 RepID=A0A4Q9B4S1_9DEIN|nr:hypothetical protein [Thermus thermamylovorans]TBH20113.1 hypothetical protein ETP66_08195 [Thermus thermamylovorans]
MRKPAKALLTITLAVLSALILSACSDPSGGSIRTEEVMVRLQDPKGAHLTTYYRVENGAWQPVLFQGTQASLSLPQRAAVYELATRCEGGYYYPAELQFFKARADQIRQVNIVCSFEDTRWVSTTFDIQLPDQIGGVRVRDGDTVAVSLRTGYVSGLSARLVGDMPEGRQDVLVSVFRTSINGLEPIGAKLINVHITNGARIAVDNQGWRPMEPRLVSAALPSGFTGSAAVTFFKDGMKVPTLVGMSQLGGPSTHGRYGILSGMGGIYLGLVSAGNADPSSALSNLMVYKDTSGTDWSAALPQPWGANQFIPTGTSFTLAYPGAQAFSLDLSGLAQDRRSGLPLRVRSIVYAMGSPTQYVLPNLESQLGYAWLTGTTVQYEVVAGVRGVDNPIFTRVGESWTSISEATFRNTDVALARLSGGYSVP